MAVCIVLLLEDLSSLPSRCLILLEQITKVVVICDKWVLWVDREFCCVGGFCSVWGLCPPRELRIWRVVLHGKGFGEEGQRVWKQCSIARNPGACSAEMNLAYLCLSWLCADNVLQD